MDSRLKVLIRDEGQNNHHVVEGISHNLSDQVRMIVIVKIGRIDAPILL